MKFILICLLVLAQSVLAKDFDGFIQTQKNKIYVKHKQAKNNKPTFVLLNGLTQYHEHWNEFIQSMLELDSDIGTVQIDLMGMGKTLAAHRPVNYDITYEDQVADIKDVTDQLSISGQKYLLGLSYGGGLTIKYAAHHPDDFDGYIPVAPYIEPIPEQVQWINKQIRINRFMFPFNQATDDELYAYFLRVLVYTTFPLAEPIWVNKYDLSAVYRMALGSRHFLFKDYIDLVPHDKMHMIYAGRDEYLPRSKFSEFAMHTMSSGKLWKSWSELEKQGHKVPNEAPKFLASYVLNILKLAAQHPKEFWFANSYHKTVRNLDNSKQFKLESGSDCVSSLLRNKK